MVLVIFVLVLVDIRNVDCVSGQRYLVSKIRNVAGRVLQRSVLMCASLLVVVVQTPSSFISSTSTNLRK